MVPARALHDAVGGGAALISWSGSMFEYLMPSLVMRAPTGSVLERTNRLIVQSADQIWAQASGFPGACRNQPTMRAISILPINIRASASRASVSSAASGESTRHRPVRHGAGRDGRSHRGCGNFKRLAEVGALWPLWLVRGAGLYAVRLPEGETVAVVRAYMAHHQGMTIVAIADALLDAADAQALPCRADDPGH